MAKNDFQYGGWNYYTLQCGTIMTLISPGPWNVACGSGIMTVNSPSGSTLQCVWYVAPGWQAVELAWWQHPAMWHIALESWHWIRQVAAPCNVPGGSGMTRHGIRPNVRRIGFLHLVSVLTISPQSTCHSAPVCEILSKSDHPQQKKMTSCRFSRWRL